MNKKAMTNDTGGVEDMEIPIRLKGVKLATLIDSKENTYNAVLINDDTVYTTLGIGTVIDRAIKDKINWGQKYVIDIDISIVESSIFTDFKEEKETETKTNRNFTVQARIKEAFAGPNYDGEVSVIAKDRNEAELVARTEIFNMFPDKLSSPDDKDIIIESIQLEGDDQ